MISADIRFADVGERSMCDLVLYYEPSTRYFLGAGLGGDGMYGIRHFDNRGWITHSVGGERRNLESGRFYRLEARLQGSRVDLWIDGVLVTSSVVPFSLAESQVGLWCRDDSPIEIRDFTVASIVPKVFVVMEFSEAYTELHNEVIKVVCGEFGLDAMRADETYGPGLIIADIVKQIDESKFIIAEITPANPNVYYEVGYAHARGKPVILVADRNVQKLPFDVSPFRALFYENSISGKRKFEEGLRHHIKAILEAGSLTSS